jgi:ankyrin repeat protein
VKLLIDNQCDINVISSYGNTALVLAASITHLECVKLLIDNHCDVNAKYTKGQPALILAAKNGNSDCVKQLMDIHCDVNVSGSYGNTALIKSFILTSIFCVSGFLAGTTFGGLINPLPIIQPS